MKTIQVEVRAQTIEGMLYPHYNLEAQVLEVSSKSKRAWPYGVDIDGTIIFDLDANRVLSNFDLLVPKRLWRIVPSFEPQLPTRKGQLLFSEESIKHKSFHLPINVTMNRRRDEVSISFGKTTSNSYAISLSEKCIAFIESGMLVGFFLYL